jgi:metallo-beta-lactamase family protein
MGTVPFSRPTRIIFTGDLGQWDRPIVRNPTVFTEADYLVMESTYGDRQHESHETVESQLEQVIVETVGRGGKVIVPIFAIERAQELIYYLSRLLEAGRISGAGKGDRSNLPERPGGCFAQIGPVPFSRPELPVYLDSPMAAQVNDVFRRHRECFDAEAERMVAARGSLLKFPSLRVVRTVEESMAINTLKGPAVIMSTSGMCTAGRIKHHLAHHIGDPACTILFVGYQAEGTLGRQILDGNPEVRIHGINRLVRAEVRQIQGISGHADRDGLLKWLGYFQQPPRRLFITHGEPQASLSLADTVRRQMGWKVSVPEYRETVQLELGDES